jgi:hypothetical protein
MESAKERVMEGLKEVEKEMNLERSRGPVMVRLMESAKERVMEGLKEVGMGPTKEMSLEWSKGQEMVVLKGGGWKKMKASRKDKRKTTNKMSHQLQNTTTDHQRSRQ